ncbi:MAG TPA: LamG-like jellyroll fold domain-containing protein, partial [Armatimonadota bacterium]|nr:LamG-like jellyroll fold domain-containing protein [Armatimonadota bacterium]
LHTGEVKVSYAKADADTYWFHHRCYRGKATDRFLMVSRTGTEFIDPTTGHWDINHWTRGACLYGLMPANGLTYTPPNSCACYPESRLSGFNALTAALPEGLKKTPKGSRLQRGPAYGDVSTPTDAPSGDWPTYRHDARRSGGTPEALAPALAQSWETSLGGGLSAVTVADGKVFVADVDAHAVHALDAASGELSWTFVAGGRVDSPPTIHGNTALFGCADGSAYCVRASDGVLVWRFRLAPIDSRIIAREQLESRWPVPGSVLVHEGEVYAVAGRSLFLDGGIRFCKLDAATGALITESILDDRDPETGEDVQSRISRLTMPVALPDVLSTDGAHVYMRSQVFDMDGTRADLAIEATQRGTHAAIQEGDTAHLFSDAGFLDGTYYHRSYWLYGRNFEGGWNSYYLAGQNVPAGKILSYNEESVFGFGRQPKYYKWTVPMEFHLFSAPLRQGADEPRDEFLSRGTIIRVEKSASLNPAGKPLAAMAWARPQQPDGVILARGGNSLGYALYLKDGIPRFALRANGEGTEVAATEPITDAWAHVTGVLTPDAELRIYINGELAGTKAAPGLLPNDPAEALQIGGDESSKVGEYGDSLGFRGIIDEVRVYHGDLPEAAIQGFAGVAEEAGTGDAALALYLSFNKENASDTSGNKNNGTIVGAESARGQAGAGMRFSGRMPNGTASGVIHTWSEKVPLLARGLVLAGDTLFVAGPDDLLDEPAALAAPESPETQEKIAAQSAALAGESGGVLRAVASGDGTLLSEMRLDTIPVWDGMAATNGSLYIAGIDGTVRCLSAE